MSFCKHQKFLFLPLAVLVARTAVGTVMGFGMDGWDLIPGRGEGFSLLHREGAQISSYPVDTGGSFMA
jgi:hypothetical protein